MRHFAIAMGATALALSGMALAKPGNGHGNGHGYGHEDRDAQGVGVGGCPPGLRNKGCMPPGQAKKLYRGERYEPGYGMPYAYQSIPYEIRHRYDLSPRYRYYYGDGRIYVVNPRTLLVADVINALLR